MRASAFRSGRLQVTEMPDPVPGSGQVLVRTIACGICGSDLHAREHFAEFASFSGRVSGRDMLQADRPLVFGHEFSAEVLDYGPDTERVIPVGTTVCSMPMVLGAEGPEAIGYSHRYPGGFAEHMVLQEMLLRPVPAGLDPLHAALTEPLAVGEHAVVRADVQPGSVCVVVGCGPVGLAVILALKSRGLGPVIAADFSPLRRRLAEQMGADVVLDPGQDSPFDRWSQFGVPATGMERSMATMLGATPPDAVVFEAVGVPGVLESIVEGAAAQARVVVVGVCMEPDTFQPAIAITKELDVRFVLGYSDEEFTRTLQRLGEGKVDADALITTTVGLDDVESAFDALKHPDEQAKVLVRHAAG
ncbi:MAG TPA: zinc-binding dehydrogenase [Mycobacteriales bacterium]|jgi:threonine dehydrogenase-like Zn-dependent dehydrogenase|nr:zinc-binding dehydrogenase [Mycobacteriales bacterium]